MFIFLILARIHIFVKRIVNTKFKNISSYKNTIEKTDEKGVLYQLGYLRTKESKEVDFALFNEKENLTEIIEAKVSDAKVSKTLEYFSEKYKVKGTQVVYNLNTERVGVENIEIKKAENYLINFQ